MWHANGLQAMWEKPPTLAGQRRQNGINI